MATSHSLTDEEYYSEIEDQVDSGTEVQVLSRGDNNSLSFVTQTSVKLLTDDNKSLRSLQSTFKAKGSNTYRMKGVNAS